MSTRADVDTGAAGTPETAEVETVDAVVVGAGFCGLYTVWALQQRGLTVRGIEAAPTVGGVWYWNRYPGARTDTPQEAYRLTFDQRLVEWRYSRKYPEQREVLQHLDFAADTFGIRDRYHFSQRVVSARFDEAESRWTITTDRGRVVRAQYFITGLGLASESIRPAFPGAGDYRGRIVYSTDWPEEGLDLAGQRVALIGVGSTGVQLAPAIAPFVRELTVFQRTPNYVIPSQNPLISDAEHDEMVADYERVRGLVRSHPVGFPFELSTGRTTAGVDREEVDRVLESLWERGGFAFLYTGFDDVLIDLEANALLVDFVQRKIRSIVQDPDVAARLTPSYPYGAKRPPTSDGYYETYNRPNVDLVSLREDPIVRFTERGIETQSGEREFDVVIVATGFDSATGPFNRIDIRGRGGAALTEHWAGGPSTYLGIAVHDFPNMLMVAGPHSPFANLPPGAERIGRWVADLVATARREGAATVEPTREAEQRWNARIQADGEASPILTAGLEVNSAAVGANVAGKARAFYFFNAGMHAYSAELDAEEQAGYPGFRLV